MSIQRSRPVDDVYFLEPLDAIPFPAEESNPTKCPSLQQALSMATVTARVAT